MIPIRTSIPYRDLPFVVIVLIVINVAVFLLQIAQTPPQSTAFLYEFALVPALFQVPDAYPGVALTLLSNTFMHGGILHLLVNMWTLWLFGGPLADRMGALRFLAFYLLCGLIASLAHLAFNLDSTVPALGASGAIAGVLGGFTRRHPRALVGIFALIIIIPVVFNLPALAYTGIWFLLQIMGGLADLGAGSDVGGIAWWAHIGGFVAGLILIDAFGYRRDRYRAATGERPRTLEFGPQRPGVAEIDWSVLRKNRRPWGARRTQVPEQPPAREPVTEEPPPAPTPGKRPSRWEFRPDGGRQPRKARSRIPETVSRPRPWGA